MAAPAVVPVDALASVEEALRLLDDALPPSQFKSRTIRALALYVAEMRFRERRQAAGLPPARRLLRSHRLVK